MDYYLLFCFVGLAIVQWLLAIWIKSRLESSIKSEYDRKMADYNHDLKIRDQAAIVADLISKWIIIKDTTKPEDKWRELNKLSFEAALWLPDDVAIEICNRLQNMKNSRPVEDLIIECRKIIHKTDSKLKASSVTFFGT